MGILPVSLLSSITPLPFFNLTETEIKIQVNFEENIEQIKTIPVILISWVFYRQLLETESELRVYNYKKL